MKKKLLLLCAVVGALIAIMAVTASAAIYYDEDFSDPAVLADKTKIGYSALGTEGNLVEVVTEDADVTGDGVPDGIDGSIHMYNDGGDGSLLEFPFPGTISANRGNCIFRYDIMLGRTTDNFNYGVAAMTYFGGVRHNCYFRVNSLYSQDGTIQANHTAGQWYTYAYHVNEDSTKINFYRKLQSEPDSSFVYLGSCNASAHSGSPRYSWSVNKGQKVDVYFDNIKLYNGTNVVSQEISVDGSEIEEITDVRDGELKASLSVLSNLPQEGLSKLFVAYDKMGKLLECTAVEEESVDIVMGNNDLSAVMNLDAATAAAIADGGYVGLYIWDGMLPVMTPLELQ